MKNRMLFPAGRFIPEKENDFRTPDRREQGVLHRKGEGDQSIPEDRFQLADASNVVRDGWNRSNVFMEAVSFNYLPIKLISHIYEDFLTNRCLVDEINSA